MPPAAVMGARLGGGSGQEGGGQSDWDGKMSGTAQACSSAVSDATLLNGKHRVGAATLHNTPLMLERQVIKRLATQFVNPINNR